jgi:hypothetical protein
MHEKINFWSFIFSIVCIILFLTVSFSGWFSNSKMGIHPLTIVLFITLFTFLAGVFGLSGVRNWKGMARSVSTIIVTLSLSAFLGCVLLFGSLLN